MIKRRVRKIEYEGVHLVCFGCGIYGHNKKSCPFNAPKVPDRPLVPQEASGDMNGKDPGRVEEVEPVGTKQVEPDSIRNVAPPEVFEHFNPWMLVTRKTRRVEMKGNVREGSAKKQ